MWNEKAGSISNLPREIISLVTEDRYIALWGGGGGGNASVDQLKKKKIGQFFTNLLLFG